MKRLMNATLLLLGFLTMIGASSQSNAYGPYIRTGLYNYGRTTYYIDGNGAYCLNYAYDNRWRQLTYQEYSELSYMNYTGVCGHP